MPSKSQKAKIRAYANGQRRCYCGVQLNWTGRHSNSATFEHLVPRSQGGTWAKENGMIVCSKCNEKRANRCWIKYVNETNPPKKEWLIQKYLEAVLHQHMKGYDLKIRRKVIDRAIREC